MPQDFAWLAWMIALGATLWAVVATRQAARSKREVAAGVSQAKELQERERLLRSLLDASPLAVILCADSGRIVYDNETARRMFFEGKAAEGQNFLRLVANGPDAFQAALLGASDEIVGLTVDGHRETYHFARRNFEFAGQPHTLLVVRPMTREIARHDLDTLRTVVRLISHEVNNSLAPVSSLMHSARLILATRDRLERLERVFDTVEERSRHLSDFIAGYASLARLPRPAPQHVEWRPLLSRLSALFPQASVTAPADARGFFDPGQLEQALINLLKNANEAGGPREEVRLEVEPLPEEGTELRILDRGAGFSVEAMESALLPFFTTKAGGTGLGLALVREIVQAHEGRLTLASREGGGAAITLLLPGLKPDTDATKRARLTLTRA
ncbi:MAG: two-component system sensor histidine kinase [Myxococcaceae bacterium]|nr:two-component system sensor histidine kinase [Myxococcaceae bacterium]